MTLKKHALNKDFIWQNANGPFVLISDQQAQQWNQSGFFVLEDVLPADLITSVKAAIDPMEAKTNAFLLFRSRRELRFVVDDHAQPPEV